MDSSMRKSMLWPVLLCSVVVTVTCQTNIRVVTLRGTPKEMGAQYGSQLRQELSDTLSTLVRYASENGIDYRTLAAGAQVFHERYSFAFEPFLKAIAEGSGLSFDDVKILNGMETLSYSTGRSTSSELRDGACAYMYIPPGRTSSGSGLVGRNYDYPKPFDEVSRSLVVAVLDDGRQLRVAIVGLPGQIYCPTCVGEAGLLLELNNGGPSGGFWVEQQRKSLLINMLEFLQQANSFDTLVRQLFTTQSDYSLIINVAGRNGTRGFEYSSSSALGMKPFAPEASQVYVSTNFYQNDSWVGIPPPVDEKTWFGVTRRNNLLKLAEATSVHSVQSVQQLMDVRLEDGGAVWNNTIYQMVLDMHDLVLYLRSWHQRQWTAIDLQARFTESVPSETGTSHTWMIIAVVFIGLFAIAVIVAVAFACSARKQKQRLYA